MDASEVAIDAFELKMGSQGRKTWMFYSICHILVGGGSRVPGVPANGRWNVWSWSSVSSSPHLNRAAFHN